MACTGQQNHLLGTASMVQRLQFRKVYAKLVNLGGDLLQFPAYNYVCTEGYIGYEQIVIHIGVPRPLLAVLL